MNRRSWTAKRKLAVFEAHGGCCHICGGKIQVGEPWDLEHQIPLALGGDDDESNVAPAHVKCHRAKTTQDAARIAKANRVRAKHMGAKPTPKRVMPGSRASKWKKKLNGQVVRRDQI